MIKERLKRLVSVVAAAAIAISALCAPIGAQAVTYEYYINLDSNGNIVSQYNEDKALVDLTTPMEPLAFIKDGEKYSKVPTVYPWEELSVTVWRGLSGGIDPTNDPTNEIQLDSGKIEGGTMSLTNEDMKSRKCGRYFKVSKSSKEWSMTISCKDLSGDSLGKATISWDANGEASVAGLDFDNNICYDLYQNKGDELDLVCSFGSSEGLLNNIKSKYDADDSDWENSFSIVSNEIKEISITASPLTSGTSSTDITFSLSTNPSYDAARLSYKALLDANATVVPDVAPNLSIICGSTYKLYVEIVLDSVDVANNTKVKVNGIELERKSDNLTGTQGYYRLRTGSYGLWYTFTVPHSYTDCDGKPATCTEDGYGKYYECESCGQLFRQNSDGYTTIGSSTDSSLLIPKTGHDFEEIPEKTATCTENGNIKYYKCKTCGKLFSTNTDLYSTDYISIDDTVIAAGHTYTNDKYPNGKFVDNADGSTHKQVCAACGEAKADCKNEAHSYGTDNKCTKCGYQKPAETTATTTAVTTAVPTTTTAPVTSYYYTGTRPNVVTTTTAAATTTTAVTTTTTTTTTTTKPVDDVEEKPDGPFTENNNGWNGIKDEINNADKGDVIHIDMNGTTKLPQEILEEIQGKDVTLEIDMGDGFVWEINGKDVTDPRDLDLGVSKGSGIPVRVINALTGECTYVTISLDYEGEFGCKAVLKVDMGENNSGYWANLYWFIPDDESFEFTSSGIIDNNGVVRLEFVHASEYVIVLDDHNHGKDVDAEIVVTEGDNNPHTGVVLSFSAVTLAAAVVVATKKKRK